MHVVAARRVAEAHDAPPRHLPHDVGQHVRVRLARPEDVEEPRGEQAAALRIAAAGDW
jgi:hypothetical protein